MYKHWQRSERRVLMFLNMSIGLGFLHAWIFQLPAHFHLTRQPSATSARDLRKRSTMPPPMMATSVLSRLIHGGYGVFVKIS